jgi:acetyl esterase/lipase
MKPHVIDRRDPPWVAEIVSKRIVYAVPGMEQVKVHKNLVYKDTDEEELQADVYLPHGLTEGECRPAIFFIHGGALPPNLFTQPKEWGTFVSYGQLAAVSGFVGITFNHRYYGIDEKDIERSIGDVTDAIAYVRNHAGSLHVDPEKVCLWAFSGGGPHLVIAMREPLDYIRCIVSYYAILDLGHAPVGPGNPPLPTGLVERYSPARYVNEKNPYIPPVFVARAGLDYVPLNLSVDEFISSAFACGLTIEVSNHAAGRHSFDILDDDVRSREIIARTIDFVKSNLFSGGLKNIRFAQSLVRASGLLQKGDLHSIRNLVRELKADKSASPELLDRVFSESALNRVGYLLMGQGKTKEAVAVFEWAVEEHPDSPGAWDNLGNSYEADGRKQEALRITEKTLQLLKDAQGLSELHVSSIRYSAESRLKRLQIPE